MTQRVNVLARCKDPSTCKNRKNSSPQDSDECATCSDDESCPCITQTMPPSYSQPSPTQQNGTNDHAGQSSKLWQKKPSSRLYWVGYLAGIAGGEIEVQCHYILQYLIMYSLTMVFSTLSIVIAVLLLPLIAFDCCGWVYFWAQSIREAYCQFRSRLGRRTSIFGPPDDPSVDAPYECDPDRWKSNPWGANNVITDAAFVLYTVFLLIAHTIRDFRKRSSSSVGAACIELLRSEFKVPKCYENSPTIRSIQRARSYTHSSWLRRIAYFIRGQWLLDHIRIFRQHLADNPPDFPITCHDQLFGIDDCNGRFQLCMLFIVDKLDFEEVAEAFRRRWITWEPKTRGVVGRRWGRQCWRVQRGNAFNLDDHIIRKPVDFRTTSVAEVISAMGSEEMPSDKPQWQVWYLDSVVDSKADCDPTLTSKHTPAEDDGSLDPSADCSAAVNMNTSDAANLSYICGKWSHIYADGSGMMAGIVTRLGDKCVSMADLPENYRRTVPKWQVALYYTYHSVVAAVRGLRIWCYWSFAQTRYPALMQADFNHTSLPRPLTGRKYYSAPGVFDLNDIQIVRNGVLKEVGIKPTVNDIFASCISHAVGRLADPIELDSIVRTKLNLPPRNRGAFPLKCSASRVAPNRLVSIIPMMVRTGVPDKMDNFTSLVNVTLPLPQCFPDNQRTSEIPSAIKGQRSVQRHSEAPSTPPTQPASPITMKLISREKSGSEAERILAALPATSPGLSILLTKAAIDKVKKQKLRESVFLMFCGFCKALPEKVAAAMYKQMYCNVQVCSTNVAAPPIASRFFGREVRGLFFWPAVPSMLTIGTSVVSLGSRFQLLTVLDECEVLPAVDVAKRIFQEEQMSFGEEERQEVIDVMSDVLVSLVVDRFHIFKTTYRQTAIDHC